MNIYEFSEWYADNYLEETFWFWLFLVSLIFFAALWRIRYDRRNRQISIYDFSNQTSEEYQ